MNRLLLFFVGTCLSLASRSQNTLVIQPDILEARITPYLYGAGAEDVNHEIYGGLYDQMIFGESFEEPDTRGDGVSHMWRVGAQTGGARYQRIEGDALNGQAYQVLQHDAEQGEAVLVNQGLNHWGICVQKGKTLVGGLFLRGDAPLVSVALQSGDGSLEYARCRVKLERGEYPHGWQKYIFRLRSQQGDDQARFAICLGGMGRVEVDQVSLFHSARDQYRRRPYRADIAEAFTCQGLTFLRYGGSMVNAPGYLTRSMMGPAHARPPYKGWWYPYSTHGFGIAEFCEFGRLQGYEMSFAINIEDQPEDVIALLHTIQHCKVKYLEIGNEEVLWNGDVQAEYEHYTERFLALYEAIHPVFPDLQFVIAAWCRADSPNVEKLFRTLDGKAAYWDFHPWTNDFASALQVEPELRRMQRMFYSWNPSTTMRCAIFEENGDTHNLRRALCHVIVQNAVRRMGDFVLTTCPANALEPYLQNDNGWNQGQIFFTPSQVWGMPPYYAQQMASEHHQPFLVRSKMTQKNPQLDVTVTRDRKGSSLMVHVVNMSDRVESLSLSADGYHAVAQTILQGDLNDENLPDSPCRVVPQTQKLQDKASVVLPACSYSIIEMAR